jgi:hypothetical protein
MARPKVVSSIGPQVAYLSPGKSSTTVSREFGPFSDLLDEQLSVLGRLLKSACDGKVMAADDPLVQLRDHYDHEAGLRFMEDGE